MADVFDFKCAKCGDHRFNVNEMRGSSGGFMAAFDMDDRTVSLITCRRCRYVEMYRMSRKEFLKTWNLDGRDH
jgi:predicted nucleic-acid-binding Zn-ribbon protein